MKVLVLGGTGMLGSMLVRVLAADGFEVTATCRGEAPKGFGDRVNWVYFDAENHDLGYLYHTLRNQTWVVNAIGITKPYLLEDTLEKVRTATFVNVLFPIALAIAANYVGAQVLQIATDCVYSGRNELALLEGEPHDALDVYGKTKSLGESAFGPVSVLRTSIIGPEVGRSMYLLEWLRSQPRGASVPGFTNHTWNGITTLHFARICSGILCGSRPSLPLMHLVPFDTCTKYELLSYVRVAFDLEVEIVPRSVGGPVRRILGTRHPQENQDLWGQAGYTTPPTIPQMVEELAAWERSQQVCVAR